MAWRPFRRLSRFWRNVARRSHVEQELDAELCGAFDLLVDEHIARGLSAEEARRAARLELGNVDTLKEHVRDVRAGASIDILAQDVRYGVRLLRRNPLFALTASLSLALGIGANTTIFTVANRLLLREPTGVADAGRLVEISPAAMGGGQMLPPPIVSYPNYLDIRERTTTLDGVFGYQIQPQPLSLGGRDGAERIFGTIVTGNYFSVLGVRPAAGRLFGAGDSEAAGASPILVLSHAFWTRRFGADPSIVGRSLQINGRPFTVVGVAAEGFRGTSIVIGDVWVPVGMAAAVSENGETQLRARFLPWLIIGGRLKPSVSRVQAAAEIDALGAALRRDYPRENREMTLRVSGLSAIPSLLRVLVGGFLALLMGIVSVVLVIACANVAGILLARAAARRQEIGVRLALGAGRWRLARQMLTETMLLFLLGGTAGLFVARETTLLLASSLPVLPVPVDLNLPLDLRVVMFTSGLSLVAALLSGLVPALQASKQDVVSVLKAHSQGPSDRLRLRHAFVVAQVAFSILLVVSAGLLMRAMQRTTSVDLGYDPHGVEVADVDMSLAGYTRASGSIFAREIVDRLGRVPGVEHAAVATGLPMEGMRRVQTLRRRGDAPPVVETTGLQPNWSTVGPGYFATLRIPLVAGREFVNDDRDGAQRVAIVSERTARQLWPGQDAIGKYLPAQPPFEGVATAADGLLVVGVARNLNFGSTKATVYVPLSQSYESHFSILARSTSGQRLAAEIRSLMASINPNLPIVTSRRLEDQTSPVLLQLRVTASVSGTVGVLGLLLASIGIYGVTAYTVTRRTREIGIRIAMGAQRKDVVGMVLRQGMFLVATGAAIGLSLAAVSSRLLTRMLFGVPPLDVISFGGAVVLFAAVGLAACYLPVRRATRINAMDVLRYE